MQPKILVILASVREGRRADQVLAWFRTIADARTDMTFEYADLKEISLPMFAQAGLPKMIEHEYTDPTMKSWVETVEGADGFIVITPEYNHGYPPSIKNALDYVYAGWGYKPMTYIAYGGVSGGLRAIEQLRSVGVELNLVPIHDDVTIPAVSRAFNEAGDMTDPLPPKRVVKMLDSMNWWATALKDARSRFPLPSVAA